MGIGHANSNAPGTLIINGGLLTVDSAGATEAWRGALSVGESRQGNVFQTDGDVLVKSTTTEDGTSFLDAAVQIGRFGASQNHPTAAGYYDLQGGTLTTEIGNVVVGQRNLGEFTQSDGTTVTIGSIAPADLVIGYADEAAGIYTMNGGSLNVNGLITVGAGSAALNFGAGEITLAGNHTGANSFETLNAWFNVTGDPTSYTETYNSGAGTTTLSVDPVPPPQGLIPIVNASFEDPVVADGAAHTGPFEGWTLDAGAWAIWNPEPANFSAVPDGDNAFILTNNGGTISQTLGATFGEGLEYDLSAYIGVRADEADGYTENFRIGLYRGGTELASVSGNLDDTMRNTWVQYGTPTYTATAADAGQPIRIVISNPGGGGSWQFSVDDVQLTAVPEPSTLLLAALGLIGLAGIGRRRAG